MCKDWHVHDTGNSFLLKFSTCPFSTVSHYLVMVLEGTFHRNNCKAGVFSPLRMEIGSTGLGSLRVGKHMKCLPQLSESPRIVAEEAEPSRGQQFIC